MLARWGDPETGTAGKAVPLCFPRWQLGAGRAVLVDAATISGKLLGMEMTIWFICNGLHGPVRGDFVLRGG